MSVEKQATSAPVQRITLEQWRCLTAVVEAGGYAKAAEALHKSQSTVTYSVQKLESSLGVRAFEIRGRKAVLTPTGQMLYRRARILLEEASAIELAARKASAGWEAEIVIAVETNFPSWLMFECLSRFGAESPHTRVEWFEIVLHGAAEGLQNGSVDLAIGPHVPPGYAGEPLMGLRFILVAHPEHALHKLERELTVRDLRKHRHLVVRDTGMRRDKSGATIEVQQRWTLSHMSTSIGAASRGHGFAWLPEDKIRLELADGVLKPLPLRGGNERFAQLYLVFADADGAGPGTLRLAEIIREEVERSATPPAAS